MYKLSSSRCSSRGSSRGSSRRSSVDLGSDEESWYNRSSGQKLPKSGGRKPRQVWGGSPGVSITPAAKGRSAPKHSGETHLRNRLLYLIFFSFPSSIIILLYCYIQILV